MIIEGVLSIQPEKSKNFGAQTENLPFAETKLEYDKMANQAAEERRSERGERSEKGREAAV